MQMPEIVMRQQRLKALLAVITIALIVLVGFGPATVQLAHAAITSGQSAGTVSPGSPTTTFAGQFTASNQAYPTVACSKTPGSECDNFMLHVSGVSDATHVVSTTITYAKPSGQEELDLYIFDSTGKQIAAENTTTNSPKTVSFPAATGAYTITVVPSTIAAPEQYTAAITLTNQPPSTGPGTGPMSATVAAPTDPRYQNYVAPDGLGTTAGEPSIGVNWQTGEVMY